MYEMNVVENLTMEFGTPLYVYDLSKLHQQIQQLKDTLGTRVRIAYSLKANPNKGLTRFISKYIAYADVTSVGEIRMALSSGFSASNLLYIGPAKTAEEIEQAVRLGIANFVCESFDEVQEVERIAMENAKLCCIILRVNPVLPRRKAGIQMTGTSSKFGIDEAELLPIINNTLRLSHIRLTGLHAYIGTQILDAQDILENLEHVMKLTLNCESETECKLDYLGFGGGYGIAYFENEKPLNLSLLKEGVEQLFDKYPSFIKKEVVSESGRFIAATCGSYIMRVLRVKESLGREYVITDGGLHQHAAACGIGRFVRRQFPIYAVKTETRGPHSYEITGRLCTSTDSFGYYQCMPKLKKGDLLVIPNAGAYCYNMSPLQFLEYPSPKEILI